MLISGIKELFGCDGNCKIALKSYNGKYVVAENTGYANANRGALGPWEIWTVTFIGDNKVQLKGYHGKYLKAEKDNDDINANSPIASTQETFTVAQRGDGFTFKSYKGKYLVAGSPTGHLNTKASASNQETFKVEIVGN